VTKTVK